MDSADSAPFWPLHYHDAVPETRFGFNLVGIATQLQSTTLAVPLYQRSYAWGEDDKERDQVQEFWTDLRGTFVLPGAEYFLGTVVLSKEGVEDRTTIIDGQQRLATTTILLGAIRDEFEVRGDHNRAGIIQSTYLATADLRTGGQIPQIVMNTDDDEYFRKRIIDGDSTTEPTTHSHKLIDDAYMALRQQISATADDAAGTWADRLMDWVEFLRDRVRVIVVEVPTEADAFLIFETLNDRGADLTIADLLKNYLFGRSSDRLDLVRGSWLTALANLDISAAGSQLFTDFLRHLWSSKYGATRERELYARIKERVTTTQNVVDFAADIQSTSRLYAAILNSDHEYWSTLGVETKDNLDVLSVLNLEQNRPLILAAMQHFDPQELRKTFRAMVSWGVRGLIVGGIGGGTAERLYCDAAVNIRSGEIKTVNVLAVALGQLIHSDDEFESAFKTARITRGPLARYILRALERTAIGTAEPELVPNKDEAEVNLEHVLPRNPVAAQWPQFTPEQYAEYVHRIGNLALLSKGPNGSIGNKPFSDKKPILAASQLTLTQLVGNRPDWTPPEITDRQEHLASLAVQTWRVAP